MQFIMFLANIFYSVIILKYATVLVYHIFAVYILYQCVHYAHLSLL